MKQVAETLILVLSLVGRCANELNIYSVDVDRKNFHWGIIHSKGVNNPLMGRIQVLHTYSNDPPQSVGQATAGQCALQTQLSEPHEGWPAHLSHERGDHGAISSLTGSSPK